VKLQFAPEYRSCILQIMPRPERWLTQSRRIWLWIALGIALRLLLIWLPRPSDDDTTDYLALGHNLLHYGVYGQGTPDDLAPTLFRLPGYPIILGLFEWAFARFWPTTWQTVLLITQAATDLISGLLLAGFARRYLSPRAGEIALALAMLCPFTAAFAGIALTESFSVFALSLGIYAVGRALAEKGSTRIWFLLLAGAASAFAMLLRPDGVLQFIALAAGLLWYTARPISSATLRRTISASAIYACVALAPIAIWTLRNWQTFHVFQPLAPRHLNDPGERFNKGFYDWLRTWSTEFITTANVFWNVGSESIDLDDISSRAFDSPAQQQRTLALIGEYNQTHSISADLDNRFEALAQGRIHNRPVQCLIVVPTLRVLDMLLRPRTLEFDLEVDWWSWKQHPGQTIAAVLLGLINLFYVVAAIGGLLRGRVPLAWMLGGYLVMRCLLLSTMENPEPRYTIQMFPIFIIAAATAFTGNRLPAVRQSTSGTYLYAS
jgi:4-amino-4-deoxy-L-arabinose transferase-like glycosyltransferase